MSEGTKHTPGPWQLEGQFDADVSIEIVSSDGYLVFEIGPCEGSWLSAEIANARLIAAAPEQNAALIGLANIAAEIIACYADVEGTDSEPGWIVDLREALAPARAALAKATMGTGPKESGPTGSTSTARSRSTTEKE